MTIVKNSTWKPGKYFIELSGNSRQRRKALRELKRKHGLTDIVMISTGYGRIYKVSKTKTEMKPQKFERGYNE